MKTSWEQFLGEFEPQRYGNSEFRRFEHKPHGELQKEAVGGEKERRNRRATPEAL